MTVISQQNQSIWNSELDIKEYISIEGRIGGGTSRHMNLLKSSFVLFLKFFAIVRKKLHFETDRRDLELGCLRS